MILSLVLKRKGKEKEGAVGFLQSHWYKTFELFSLWALISYCSNMDQLVATTSRKQ